MRDQVRDMDASIKARLKNIAKDYKKTFNLILQLYAQERLLYRLSVSEYKDNFMWIERGTVLCLTTLTGNIHYRLVVFLFRESKEEFNYIRRAKMDFEKKLEELGFVLPVDIPVEIEMVAELKC